MSPQSAPRAQSRRVVGSFCLLFLAVWMGFASAGLKSGVLATTCPGVKNSGQWSRVSLPGWPTTGIDGANNTKHSKLGFYWDGPIHVAVDPVSPQRLYASNGQDVMRSVDGGCSWRQIFSLSLSGLPTDPASDPYPWLQGDYAIQSIVAGGGPHHVLYLSLTAWGFGDNGFVGIDPAFVAASEDDGVTWQTHRIQDASVPAAQVRSSTWYPMGELFAAPALPTTVYYRSAFYGDVTAVGSSDKSTLLVSHDAGTTWRVQGVSSGHDGFPGIHEAYEFVDPLNPNVLWRTDSGVQTNSRQLKVFRSTDAGRSYRPVLTGAPPGAVMFGRPNLSLRSQGVGSVCVAAFSPATVLVGSESGQQWRPLPQPPRLDKQSGPSLIEGAACADAGRVIALAGYQPEQHAAPPFRRSELWSHPVGSTWKRLAAVPFRLGEGSLTVAGSGSQATAFWFGDDGSWNGAPSTESAHVVWLRYNGALK